MTTHRIRESAFAAALAVSTLSVTVPSAGAAVAARPAPLASRLVVEWNQAMITSMRSAAVGGPIGGRIGAILAASVFDAVNGITMRYQPYFETRRGPAHASPAAAAIGAAHRVLKAFFPSDAATFNALQSHAVAQLVEHHRGWHAITRGVAWGRTVADDLLAWRATDGYTDVPPPYTPTPKPGRWQPTPPTFALPVLRQFATMVPFTMTSPGQFLPPPPPALGTRRYARDYNEVKDYGSATGSARTAYDTETALLWAADSPTAFWNQVADRLILSRRIALPQATRLLARMNLGMADAAVAIWNAKNYYDTWRPITAIEQAGTDGNRATHPDPNWAPLADTPTFQEYPSGHVGLSSTAADVLARAFGQQTRIVISTPLDPGVVHRFNSFRAAIAELIDARIFIGYHFRFSGQAAAQMGRSLADWVIGTQMNRR